MPHWQDKSSIICLNEKLTHEDAAGTEVILDLKRLENPEQPLILICDGTGGEAPAAYRLAAMLRTFEAPVITVVYREAASAHVIPFVCGDLRLMAPTARLGFHQVNYIGPDRPRMTVAQLRAKAGEVEGDAQLYLDILRRNGLTADLTAALSRPELTFYDADACRTNGLCDQLLTNWANLKSQPVYQELRKR